MIFERGFLEMYEILRKTTTTGRGQAGYHTIVKLPDKQAIQNKLEDLILRGAPAEELRVVKHLLFKQDLSIVIADS